MKRRSAHPGGYRNPSCLEENQVLRQPRRPGELQGREGSRQLQRLTWGVRLEEPLWAGAWHTPGAGRRRLQIPGCAPTPDVRSSGRCAVAGAPGHLYGPLLPQAILRTLRVGALGPHPYPCLHLLKDPLDRHRTCLP